MLAPTVSLWLLTCSWLVLLLRVPILLLYSAHETGSYFTLLTSAVLSLGLPVWSCWLAAAHPHRTQSKGAEAEIPLGYGMVPDYVLFSLP